MSEVLHRRWHSLNIRAGLLAAAGCGAIGAIAAAAIVAWLNMPPNYIDTALAPILGCSAVLASAGWAARAPRPTHSIAVSLLVVFAGSILMWTLIAAAEVTPRRYKGIEHPSMYPSEALALLAPPLLLAAVLTVVWSAAKSDLTPIWP